ncbi:histidine phosphatase family protein [Sphaerisporangium aureirubrum]|uniref:Histidine phosphatase family protein n=1 Tax=Sphaerisporangium aureirubrum TaxID=1544736 RepID=A0ABW1NEB6_9ACTN
MTVRLVLVCHAATAATREARIPYDDEPLDAHGEAAAGAARGVLRRVGTAYHAPEARCLRTALALGLDAVPETALADLDLGAWRGHTLEGLGTGRADALRAWLTEPDARPHGGETLRELVARVAGWLDSLPATPSRVAAVTHPAVVRAAVLHVLGAPVSRFWRLDVAPLSQTHLSGGADGWRLRETGHPLTP